MMNVEKVKEHFKHMANSVIPSDNVYVLNQRGRGLGNNRKGSILYKVKQSGEGRNPQMVTPIAQGLAQAKSILNERKVGQYQRKSIKRSKSSTRSRRRKRHHTGRISKRKTNTKRKPIRRKKSRKNNKTKSKRKRDIFT